MQDLKDFIISEGVKAENSEPWEVYLNGKLDSHFSEGAKKWKKYPKIGNGWYVG